MKKTYFENAEKNIINYAFNNCDCRSATAYYPFILNFGEYGKDNAIKLLKYIYKNYRLIYYRFVSAYIIGGKIQKKFKYKIMTSTHPRTEETTNYYIRIEAFKNDTK